MRIDGYDDLLVEIEEELVKIQNGRKPFSQFLLDMMDQFDYSNTALARKVFHRVENRSTGEVSYVPVTRQAIGAWLKGSMPSTREIYISMGLAFEMGLLEINHILLETYMGYGLYCKNIEDALWIALINGLFPIERFEEVKKEVEKILAAHDESDGEGRVATMDLWALLAEAGSLDQFYKIINDYREEFREGVLKFGQCMEEVIEEEYGYYEKASWFLRDIGLLHCEAQFSKIRAGKAIVTREWLLRFLIALQPSLSSIEKLLAKAQMEPLGVTPSEIILKMIARYHADSLANSQEIWSMIESISALLREKGYEVEDDLCRKYDSAYDIPFTQKKLFSICIGQALLNCESKRDYGYEKQGYCRYTYTDKILFEELNRIKKDASFKKASVSLPDRGAAVLQDMKASCFPELVVPKGFTSDPLDAEKFEDYCYLRKPSRLSKDFLMNDIYFYCSLLYSLWTGKCWKKDFTSENAKELEKEFARIQVDGAEFSGLLEKNLKEDAAYQEAASIPAIIDSLWKLNSGKST